MGALVHTYRDLLPVLEEHLVDNDGEVLPYVLLADAIRWMAEHRATSPGTCQDILDWLEREYRSGSPDVRGLITVGGVGNLPNPGEPGSELRDGLGASLRAVDPWLNL